jgi:transposase
MPAERLSMRKTREVLRLKWALGLTARQVAGSVGMARSTVGEYLHRAEAAGLTWQKVETLSDAELEEKLFPPPPKCAPGERPLPDWALVKHELRGKHVTLYLLWEEYRLAHPGGYGYSRFCDLYRAWKKKLDLVMRQDHKAGEKLFVDYAGDTVHVVSEETGELSEAQIFVAVLGASNYTFAEATWTQGLSDWTGSHVRAFNYIGGIVELVVPDNTKTGVSHACRYEPDINPTYQDLLTHYGCACAPARVRHPRDKAKVEVGVKFVEEYLLARLRHETFFTLAELNAAISRLLKKLNNEPFQKLPGSRLSEFLAVDVPALSPLPSLPWVYAEWQKATVGPDYHLEVRGHYYSVPYQLVKERLDVRVTENTVECFLRGKRVAAHMRSSRLGAHTTICEHMPRAHRDYAEWTPERLVSWAKETGPETARLLEEIMASRPHPQQGFRSCLGLLSLGKKYGSCRLEAACRRALLIRGLSYKSVKSILVAGLDQEPLPAPKPRQLVLTHENIRGPEYYS